MAVAYLDTRGYWAVDDKPIFVPSECEVGHDNIVTSDSGRMESGVMYISWVRSDVRKADLTYKYMTGADVEFMLNLMQGKTFKFTYYDNGIKTMDAYVGKCSYGLKDLSVYTEEGGLYKDFKINVVEM